jgi:hypothetical protein
MNQHRAAARRFSENCHRLRVAAEGRDVALNPLERGTLVHVAVVAAHIVGRLSRQRRVGEEAEPAHPVVHADDDDTLLRQRVGRVKRRAPMHEPPAVNPYHHRERRG